jgi:hypothetical protein
MGGGPGAMGASMAGQMVVELLGFLCSVLWWFIVGFYTRAIGMALRNYSVAGTAKGYLIALGICIALVLLLVVVAIATVGLVGLNVANQMGAAQAGKAQGPGAAGGAMAGGAIVLCGLGCIDFLLAIGVVIWYIVMLVQARGAIALRRGRR